MQAAGGVNALKAFATQMGTALNITNIKKRVADMTNIDKAACRRCAKATAGLPTAAAPAAAAAAPAMPGPTAAEPPAMGGADVMSVPTAITSPAEVVDAVPGATSAKLISAAPQLPQGALAQRRARQRNLWLVKYH